MKSSSRLPDGLVIPDHHLERRIGEGGYGEIWLARNVIGTYRAVKIVFRSRFDSPKPYEREFTGLKAFEPISRNHPGFVDILQVGRNDEAGYIYYVMELADDEVSGRIVDPDTYSAKTLGRERDKRGRLAAEECLRIGKSLAGTLAHLHHAGLVHRDIKPSNIIFVNGEPKLADIGLVVSLSDAGTFVGSDGYIPPEGPGTFQADIYSLGKLLYEISTGQDKNQFPELPRDVATFDDSAALLELNEVILKAGENDKRQRYKTADEVHADLEMISSGRSVKQLRFIQRQLIRVRRVAVAASALAILAAVFAAVVLHLRQQERRALAKAHVTNGVKLVEEANAGAAVPSFTAALRLQHNDPAAAESHRLRIGSALQQSPRLLQFWEFGATVQVLRFDPNGKQLLLGGRKSVRLYDIESGEQRREFTLKHTVNGTSFSRDGTRLAIANGAFVTVVDPGTGNEIFEIKKRGSVLSAEFSPDGQVIVLGSSTSSAFLIDASTGAPLDPDLKGHRTEVGFASFSPDGKLIVTASRDGTGRLWDAKTHEPFALLPHAQWVLHAQFTPDGAHVATASTDNSVFIWKVAAQPHISARMEHRGSVQRLAFSPDGRWLVSASLDHTARFWDANTGKAAASAINMHSPGLHAVFSPDGACVATAEQNGRTSVWRVPVNTPLDVGPGIVSADGERYVTFASNSFRVWNASNDVPITSRVNVVGVIASVACNADARTIAACVPTEEGAATIYVHDTEKKTTRSFQISNALKSVVLSPDGTRLLATNNSVATVYDVGTGQALFTRQDLTQRVSTAVFSADNRTIGLQTSKAVFVLDAATGTNRLAPITSTTRITSLSFTHDSSQLAISAGNQSFAPGIASLLDAHTGKRLTEFTQHMDGVSATTFAHDHRIAATAGEDSFVFVWNTETSDALLESLPLSAAVRAVRFSGDDRWLAACSWRDAQLWDVATGRALTPGLSIPGVLRMDDCGIVAGKSRLWVLSSRTLHFWDLPQAKGEPDELLALAHHLGIAIPIGIPYNPAAYPLAKLRAHCAEERQRAQAGLATWHAQQAHRFENPIAPDWFAARFHLEQLLKRNPENTELRARLTVAETNLDQAANSPNANPSAPPSL